jgi:SAM-dependent methyltransferase
VNEAHLRILSSPDWANTLREELLPWVAQAGELGEDVLELGPGPGLSTELLMERARHLTAVELDPGLAADLARRFTGTNVTVLQADATGTGLGGERFSSVVCFSMLHHVPSVSLQDLVFREAFRVLRAGGKFLGVDAVDSDETRDLHVGDVFTPMPPDTLGARLTAAGFSDVRVSTTERRVRFVASKL